MDCKILRCFRKFVLLFLFLDMFSVGTWLDREFATFRPSSPLVRIGVPKLEICCTDYHIMSLFREINRMGLASETLHGL